MATDPTYGVDSLHVHADLGDAAIHLQIQLTGNIPGTTTPVTPGRPYVLKAVLCDGGPSSQQAPSCLDEAIKAVGRTYQFSATATVAPCQFDAVIITHWDHDHHAGLINHVILNDLNIQAKDPNTAGKVSFFKYDGTTPKTILYSPNWGWYLEAKNAIVTYKPKSADDKAYVTRANGSLKRSGDPIDKTNNSTKFLTSYQNGDIEAENILISESFAEGGRLLGMEVFSGRQLPATTAPSTVANLTSLIALHAAMPGYDVNLPAMFCVAANRNIIGRSDIVSGLVGPSGRFSIINAKSKGTATNRSSIACFVVWPADEHYSHYFAGDLEDEVEDAIVSWTGLTGVAGSKALTTAKFSHHGSATSNSTALFAKLKPTKLICSANNLHFHPRWELLAYFYLYRLKLQALNFATTIAPGNPSIPDAELWTTCYPYWMLRTGDSTSFKIWLKNNKLGTSISAFDDPNGQYAVAYTALWKELCTIYGVDPTKIPSTLDKYQTGFAPIGTDDRGRRARYLWIVEACYAMWDYIAPEIRACYLPCTKDMMPVSGPSSAVNFPRNRITHIKVLSRPSSTLWQDGGDGAVVLETDVGNPALLPVAKKARGKTVKKRKNSDDDEEEPPPEINHRYGTRAKKQRVQGSVAQAAKAPASDNATSNSDVEMEEVTDAEDESEGEPGVEDSSDENGSDMDEDIMLKNTHVENDVVNRMSIAGGTPIVNTKNATHITAAALISPPSTNFYYCNSTEVTVTGISNAFVVTDSDTNDFIGYLNSAWLEVATTPTKDSASMMVSTDDEWFRWMEAVISATFITLTGTVNNIASMSLGVSCGGTNVLTFSTNDLTGQFGSLTDYASNRSILYESDSEVILGLSSASLNSLTLSNVLDLMELGDGSIFTHFLDLSLPLTLNLAGQSRNAVWFDAQDNYRTTLRLAFLVPLQSLATVNRTFFDHLKLIATSASIIVKKSAVYSIGFTPSTTGNTTTKYVLPRLTQSVALDVEVTLDMGNNLKGPSGNVAVQFDFGTGSTTITLICDKQASLADYLKWIVVALNITAFDFSLDWLESLPTPIPRRVQIILDANFKAQQFMIDFEIIDPFKKANRGSVTFLCTYVWDSFGRSEVLAHLWPATSANDPVVLSRPLLPTFEDWQVLDPGSSDAAATIKIADLIPGVKEDSWPPELPNTVAAMNFILTRISASQGVAASTQVQIYGALTYVQPDNLDQTVPKIQLGSLGLDLSYNLTSTAFDLGLYMRVNLAPPPGSTLEPAMVDGAFTYNSVPGSTFWTMLAQVQNLSAAHLYQFFDSDSKTAHGLLGDIAIASLNISYTYSSTGKATNFAVTGIIELGSILLSLEFHNPAQGSNTGPGTWSFSAKMVPQLPEDETIGTLLDYLGCTLDPPAFIANVPLNDVIPVISLNLADLTVNGSKTSVFMVDVSINNEFDLSFVRYQDAQSTSAKEIVRASVSRIPSVGVPLIDKLDQPFDEAYFVYVFDSSTTSKTGVSSADLTFLNGETNNIYPVGKPLLYKPTKSTYTPSDIVITTGLHFHLVLNSKNEPQVVVDHAFGQGTSPTSGSGSGMDTMTTGDGGSGNGPDATADANITKGSVSTTRGPISISNLGLQYKDQHLIVHIDASVKLGPIDFDLYGLGIDLDFSDSSGGFSLRKLPPVKPLLDGLGFGFSRPPVTAAGLFKRLGEESFAGGVTVGFAPYLFMAAGCYGIYIDPTTKESYKMVALFAKLEGPLIELEFAEISGICGGFGYNSLLKMPDITAVRDFPFLQQTKANTDPLSTILGFSNWIKAENHSIWLAAGLTVDAFKLITLQAVVAVDFGTDIKLGIFADAIASFPPLNPKEPAYFVYVELEILCVVDFGAGSMLVEVELAPTSYLLNPACHLFGGMALAFWFGNSQYAGDWVFSIGGYHAAYKPPAHYPVPTRVGYCWSLSDALTVLGEGYFALTPKCCMGGGHLRVQLSLGPLQAWFDARADFLINFHPFYFIGDMSVDIGVAFVLDLLFCTIHIGVDINGQLHLEGPNFHGFVHVDFWVFGFDISFGDNGARPPKATLRAFYDLLVQQANNASPAVSGSNSGQPVGSSLASAHNISCVSGLLADPKNQQDIGSNPLWQVRGGQFMFQVSSIFAIKQAEITGGDSVVDNQQLSSRPMQSSSLGSDLTITISQTIDSTVNNNKYFRLIHDNPSNVPSSMWQPYNSAEDPLSSSSGGNQSGTLLNGGDGTQTVTQMMSVTCQYPPALHSLDLIPPFEVEMAEQEMVEETELKDIVDANPAWLANTSQPKDSYTSIPQTWQSPTVPQITKDTPIQTSVAELWTTIAGWQGQPFAPTTTPTDTKRKVVPFPSKLLKTFADTALSCPMVAVGM